MYRLLIFSLLWISGAPLFAVHPWPHNSTAPCIRNLSPPAGFQRAAVPDTACAAWLRSLPLKPENTQVRLYDGRLKSNQSAQFRVIDIDVGNRDLQQCADAVMRLRAKYLYIMKKFDEIGFRFVSGFYADYATWRRGYRVKVTSNKCSWYQTSEQSTDYRSFRKYLDTVFSYANTWSLKKQLARVTDCADLQAGDVFIQAGFPGHAVIVVDVAVNLSGQKVFLLAQSYMPAQDVYILNNPASDSPWYAVDDSRQLVTPEWTFDWADLHRFR